MRSGNHPAAPTSPGNSSDVEQGSDAEVLLQELGPLNPYARRIVHLTVAEDDTLSSESIGDAFLKTIVISKKIG